MLSRVANALYWMQRYRERAENIARLVTVNLNLTIDIPEDSRGQWYPLVATTGDSQLFQQYFSAPTEENVLRFLTFDRRNPNSILNCLYRSRENGRSIRPIITSEMWHELNTAYLYAQKTAAAVGDGHPGYEFYDQIRKACQLFTGITDTTLAHNEAWHFARMGNLLERADQTSRILDVKYFMLLPSAQHVGTPYDDIQWAALLKSVSALEMYRRNRPSIHHAWVAEFLILNREFPRAIYSCLVRTEESLKRMLGDQSAESNTYRQIAQLCEELAAMTIYEIIKKGLHEFLDRIQARIIEINRSIFLDFFTLTPAEPPEILEPSLHNS